MQANRIEAAPVALVGMELRAGVVIAARHNHRGDLILLCATYSGAPFVTGRADANSLLNREWYWGHYHESMVEALTDFETR